MYLFRVCMCVALWVPQRTCGGQKTIEELVPLAMGDVVPE